MAQTTESGGPPPTNQGGTATPKSDILGAMTAEAKSYGNMLNIVYLLQFMVLIMPYFIVFLFIITSIINSNLKGFMYAFGLIIVYLIITIFNNTLPSNPKENQICALLNGYHIKPSFISGLYSYSISYMLMFMIYNSNPNIPIIFLLFIMLFVDTLVRVSVYKCLNYIHMILGSMIGAIIGFIWAYAINQSGNKSLGYFEILTSRETCTKSDGNFKCKVYKGGQIIGNTVMGGNIVN
jgi:hypothetical protein